MIGIRRSFFILITLGLCFVSLATVQAQEPEQRYTILGIAVEGTQTGSTDIIIAQSGLRKGDQLVLPSEQIRRAVSRIWQQQIFADVRIVVSKVLTQSDGTQGVYLSIVVRELPRIDTVVVKGNDNISANEIIKIIPFYKGDFARPWDIDRVKNLIIAHYTKEGYQYAAVTSDVTETTEGRVQLTYNIVEGSEVVVRHIRFTGNEKISDGDLRSAMSEIAEKKWWKIFSSGKFDKAKYEEDKKKIISYYRSEGFRDAKILGDSIWAENGKDLNILINVYEGNRYFIRNIAVVGNEVLTEQEIIRGLGSKRGDVFNGEKLDQNLRGPTPDFSDVGSLYYDRGYLAQINKEETTIGSDSIDVTVRIQEGKRFYFRNIDIAGNTKTKDYVIRRSLYTRPGDGFSRSAIIRSLRELAQLNYFNQEKLEPKVDFVPDATQVDVTYKVEERSSDTFNMSVGYGGVQGILGSIGVSFNNFDIADPLSGGAGQIFSVQAEFGQANYKTFSLGFREPWLFQEPTSLGASVYYTTSNYFYSQTRKGASLSVGRRLRWPDDFFRIDATMTGENTNILSGGGIYSTGNHDEVSLQVVLSRNSTDDPLFPSVGSELSLLSRLAYLPVKSIAPNEPANYFKNNLLMKFYTPLAQLGVSQKLVLATIVDVGQLGKVGATPYIPPTERFTMGGSGLSSGFYTIPLRGYNDAIIGDGTPTTANFGNGGSAYMRYVAEMRFQISREPIPVFVLAFAEAGNVWRDWSFADPFDLKRSAGFGARIQVPAVGLIGIDLGYGFDSPSAFGTKSGWKTHFQFGRFF